MISIIIPAYNSINLLPNALTSILKQDFKDFEIVIVDNVSTDGTVRWVEKYRENDKRVKLFSKSDNGIYDAMNKGITYARGSWLYFMGADDSLFDENVLATVGPYLNKLNDIVYGDSLWVPENIKEEGEWKYETFINANINHQRIFYRKALFEKYGSLNMKYIIAADHEMNIRFFCNERIYKKYIPVTIANFHSGGFSASKTDEVFWEDWNEIILKNLKPYLTKKEIYGTLNIYCRYLIDKGRFKKAFEIVYKNFRNTYSIGFINLVFRYFINKKIKQNLYNSK